MAEHESRGSRARQTVLVILATIGALALFAFASCVALLGVSISSLSKSFSSGKTSSVVASVSSNVSFAVPHKNTPYIAGIKFQEEINNNFADDIIAKLRYAQNDPNAVGILLEVDSPGGVVVPSQEIYDVVGNVVQTKPVVSYVRSMAASGAYYSIAPSTIVANRGSLIGSIGVIMQGVEVDELLKFLKIQTTTLKTGALKDAGSPFRPMNVDDKTYLKNLLDEIFATFMSDVKKVRPEISQKDLSFMSDGRVVLAPEALSLKLVDSIGTKETAQSEVARLAKLKSTPETFYYEDVKPFADFFTEKFISGSSKAVKEIFIQGNSLPR